MENTEQKTCQVKMHGGKPCGRPATYGDKCICHTDRDKKDIRVLQRELDKIFEDEKTEYYDLTRFYFPKTGYKLPKEYKKDTFFWYATFSGAADFVDATFSKKVVFGKVKFRGDADFWRAEFKEDAIFVGVTFYKEANYWLAEFSGDTDFTLVNFHGETNFDSLFSGDTKFCESSFSGLISFKGATFDRLVDFSNSKSTKESSIVFDGEERENRIMFAEGANITYCSLANTGTVKFRKTSLEKCRFQETNLSGVEFIDVQWPVTGKLHRRKVVYDELALSTEVVGAKPEYNLIAQLYRRLQTNYVNNYRYSEAGDFYIGEQEMMRKAKGKVGQYLSTNFLYKIISYYGESFLLPLFWLLAVLFLFPLYLIYDGIIKEGYWNAFWKNLSFVTFNRADISKYVTAPYQQGIVTIEGLLLVVLVTFFVLALRRKYKRKTF